jgi:hypothetical protein
MVQVLAASILFLQLAGIKKKIDQRIVKVL